MYIGNLGNILLIIVPAICTESGSPFGEHTVCKSKGLSYSSFSMAVSLFLSFFLSLFLHLTQLIIKLNNNCSLIYMLFFNIINSWKNVMWLHEVGQSVHLDVHFPVNKKLVFKVYRIHKRSRRRITSTGTQQRLL